MIKVTLSFKLLQYNDFHILNLKSYWNQILIELLFLCIMSLKRKYQDLESDCKYTVGKVANGLSNNLPSKSHITKWPNNILVMILNYEPFTLSMVNKHLRSEGLSLIFKSIKSPELVSKSSLKNENTVQSFLDYFSLFVKDKKKASAVKVCHIIC